MRRLVVVLFLLMGAAPDANAQGQDLAWAKKGFEQFGMQAEIHMRAYIDGFRYGYLSLYVTQGQMDGGELPEHESVEKFIDCLFLNEDTPSMYERLIAVADDDPKMLVMKWLRMDFERQCGVELRNALAVIDGREE